MGTAVAADVGGPGRPHNLSPRYLVGDQVHPSRFPLDLAMPGSILRAVKHGQKAGVLLLEQNRGSGRSTFWHHQAWKEFTSHPCDSTVTDGLNDFPILKFSMEFEPGFDRQSREPANQG